MTTVLFCCGASKGLYEFTDLQNCRCTVEYCAKLIEQLSVVVEGKRREASRRGHLHDNAAVHNVRTCTSGHSRMKFLTVKSSVI